uniref:COesterase domain-containing protein n=1 Tax=Thelazia callipaeda TaxID=103827 RepID=A0A0N5CM33_THECL
LKFLQVQKAVEYRYLSDYPQNVNDSERRDAVISIISDQHFVAPAVREALHYAYKNLTVYAYIFEYESAHLLKFIRKKGIKKGASHGNDCSLIFDNQNLSNSMLQKVAWNDNDRKVLDHLITQMTNFIHKRNLSKIGFVRFSPLHRAATKINTAGNIVSPVDFYSNVTVFWYETIPIVEQLSVEPHYRLLLKSCTMCQYPYKAPFYIILIALILITIGLLIACIHQQKRVKYKPTTYAIMHELRTVKNDEKLVMS